MIKSLFTGVSGLRGHQTMMDVIANNIANVNTAGFKSSAVTFSDVFYQTTASGNEPTTNGAGGTNSSQVGYGSQVSAIKVVDTQGGYMQTDKYTDLYISGEGYFVVGNTKDDQYFTRVGNFDFDKEGNLVDVATGAHVFGTNGTTTVAKDSKANALEAIKVDLTKYDNLSISDSGKITGTEKSTGTLTDLGQIALATFTNPEGLEQVGSSYLQVSNNSGEAACNAPGSEGAGSLVTNGLEMSNVDLSKQFTDMIIAQRGFQANARVITTSDSILEELVNLKR